MIEALLLLIALAVLTYTMFHALNSLSDVSQQQAASTRTPTAEEQLKQLILSLVGEDDWTFTGSIFRHPTGVSVRRSYSGDYFVYAEDQRYDKDFAKSCYNILNARKEEKDKAEALRRLAQKVIEYNETGILGTPELGTGKQPKGLEYSPILDVRLMHPDEMYNYTQNKIKEELYTRSITSNMKKPKGSRGTYV